MNKNQDVETIKGFGEEWTRYDQSELDEREHQQVFDSYFEVFPWDSLPPGSTGFDMGCGSGRWAKLAAPRVGALYCVDASEAALDVARRNLQGYENCTFFHASFEALPFADDSLDFGYSLGVLHHIPDTASGIRACVRKLKPGAPFLLYIYYAFDNRPWWFRLLWRVSDLARRGISRLPFRPRNVVAQMIALGIYLPLARLALLMEKVGANVDRMPLSFYRNRTVYTMKTDALDRFGTRLEQRFTRAQIQEMMRQAGLQGIRFHESAPFWCAVGRKRQP